MMMPMKPIFGRWMLALVVLAGWPLAGHEEDGRHRDYLAEEWADLRRTPGEETPAPAPALDAEVLRVEGPRLGEAGQTVEFRLRWVVRGGPAFALVHEGVFAEWGPEAALGKGFSGEAGEAGTERETHVTVALPAQAGLWRLRWTLTPGFHAVHGFFGNPHLGLDEPGRAYWAEWTVEVREPAPKD